jgi:hypothetical protein
VVPARWPTETFPARTSSARALRAGEAGWSGEMGEQSTACSNSHRLSLVEGRERGGG